MTRLHNEYNVYSLLILHFPVLRLQQKNLWVYPVDNDRSYFTVLV